MPLAKPAPAPAPEPAAELLFRLKALDYAFTTPTNATHRQVIGRRDLARDLRDAFGWSLPFRVETLGPDLFTLLQAAGFAEAEGELWRSTVRVSSLGPDLFLHSAFPPSQDDAVFFGPDTYRFARFLQAQLGGARWPVEVLVDVGSGSGAGAVAAARIVRPERLILTDVNPAAHGLARINLQAAGLSADHRLGPGLDPVTERPDLIIANPPFIAGSGGRVYRDGGDMHGARLSLDWVLTGAARLAPAGRLLMYTGAAILAGRDALREALHAGLDQREFTLTYEELDPDIFGGMIGTGAYEDVERIAALGVVVERR